MVWVLVNAAGPVPIFATLIFHVQPLGKVVAFDTLSVLVAVRSGAVFVRLKIVLTVPAAAVTVYAPMVPFAVNAPGSAMPLPFVLTDFVFVLLSKVPLWPPPPVEAVNVTGE